jgi:drug/metabolite transporter (DMT)-like permease
VTAAAIALALVAAAVFALGTVLQQRVAAEASADDARSASFIVQLARRPLWLAGTAADAGGFLVQATALGLGRIVVVQPLLSSSLVFALPLGAALDHRRIGRRELGAAVAVFAGLVLFLVVANPSGGHEDASTRAWLVSFAACAVAIGAAYLRARGASPLGRAVLLGSATGVLYGLSAGLTKAVVEQLGDGVFSLVMDWHPWALIVVGYLGMTLGAASLQAGRLAPAVATQMAFDPITSLLLGTLAFGERIHSTAVGTTGALAGIVLMVAGIAVLARADDGLPAGALEGAPA